ncbi:MAG: ActS/PrrB/RegB family redox-sensitive histidine kinase [Beijerinckiaceae bacterium]|nr:ActS/PrrB/RegB family redox-sensitive histidine kinase [Beijerinckiaceae bacterium]
MPRRLRSKLPRDHRLLRLETLLRLRWYSVIMQACLILVGQFLVGLDLPLVSIALVLAFAIALNMALHVRAPAGYRMEESAAFVLLGADILQLAALLYFAGGVTNPFSIFFLAPVLISAMALPPQRTIVLGVLAMAATTFILPYHEPLRSQDGGIIAGPSFSLWLWLALQGAIIFVGLYAWRIAEEARQLAQALAMTELLLEREQHISDLDGLAAAAAHELGTPLATIAVVAGELLHAPIKDEALKADLLLIKEQSARCRQILAQITTLGEPNAAPFRTVTVSGLVAEVVARYRDRGAPISLLRDGVDPEPRCLRNPGLLYGIGNLVQNAAEFAASAVEIRVRWDERDVTIDIRDDGPGIPGFVLERLGEPYLTSRPWDESSADSGPGGGMGLGLFIAKVLLERSGASLLAENQAEPEVGATIRLTWPRHLFDELARNTQLENQKIDPLLKASGISSSLKQAKELSGKAKSG